MIIACNRSDGGVKPLRRYNNTGQRSTALTARLLSPVRSRPLTPSSILQPSDWLLVATATHTRRRQLVGATRPSEQAVNNAQMVEEYVENKDDSFCRFRTRRTMAKESFHATETLLNVDSKLLLLEKSGGFDSVEGY